MGIDREGTEFLLFAQAMGVDFGSTITIGRQTWNADERIVRAAATGFSAVDSERLAELRRGSADGYTEQLFEFLGARDVEAIDVADYEGAAILHDMNEPIGADLHGRASCVLDGGALEHVFNFPRAIENCMQLVRPGGHLLAIVPANNQVGHGFYQFSPELYFRVLSPANGFTVRHLFINEVGFRRRWMRVTDPAIVGDRVTASTLGEASIYLIAERTGDARIVERPQQSDYAVMWTEGRGGARASESTRRQRRHRRLHRLVGSRLATVLRDLRVSVGNAGSAEGIEHVDLAQMARELASGPAPSTGSPS